MTCQTSSGNGCSLEDCYTNLFALADLTGIRWRRLRSETSTLFAQPLEDPVLITYIKCLQAEILCSWAKVQYSYGDMPKAASQLGYKRELWIFWYGDEPANLDAIVPKELVEVEGGSWDGGMSYECRTFIFKALHNRIERCLLSKKYVRLGRWFVQPHENYSDASVQLSFSFQNFSLHGDSTVCASVDVERHQPLLLVSEQHVQIARCLPTGIPVILAPYNLAGVLVGQSPGNEHDVAARNLLRDWHNFYPMDKRSWSFDSPMLQASEQPGSLDLSPLLDVVVGGVHMRYPAQYVLIPKDYPSPSANSTFMPSAGSMDIPSDLLALADDTGVQTALPGTPQHKTGLGCSRVRPRPPPPAVEGVVQKTFEEACILSTKRAPVSSSAAAGAGVSQLDDEPGQWSLCDPSTKHNCVCGRQASGACKSSMQPVIGSRGGPALAARQICMNPTAPFKQLKVEKDNSVMQTMPVKKLSFHRRLQWSAIPSAAGTGERLATFSCYSSHRRKVKDSVSPLSAVTSPCVGGPQSIAAGERIMPTLSPQNPSRDSANSAASESQSSRPSHHSSNQNGTASAAISQILTDPSAYVPFIQGQFSKLPQDLVAGMPSAACSSHMQVERIKRPHLPIHPAIDCNRVVDSEDLSTPSLYDFEPSDNWLAHPMKKLKLLPDLHSEGLVTLTSQRKAMPYSLVCLNNQASAAAALGAVQGKGSAITAECQHLPLTETCAIYPAYDADQHPVASPRVVAQAASTIPLSTSLVDEPKSTRSVISPSSPMPLPFGTGLKSVNSLQPKLSDLDNIFDTTEEMDTSLSPDGTHGADCFPNEHGKGSSLMSAVVNGTIGVSELSQMFPTPPSLEGGSALSPAGCHDGFGTIETHCQSQPAHYYDSAASSSSVASAAFTKCDEKQDSPTRFVRTPQFSKYVTSIKYAPIDLPSSKLLPVILPATPQWHNADAKLGKSQPTPSFFSKPSTEVTSLSAALQPVSSFNHENSMFFVSPSPSTVSCSSHLVGLDNPSPASSSMARKVGAIPTPVDASMLGAAHASIRNGTTLSEANSLVVNVMLSDSLLNLFKDASFDSCNICICNTNIKGTDVGLYLPDPIKEAQYRCTCGFSAAVNRSNGYCSGLFYEDEADITGIRDDRFDDHRLPLDPTALAIKESATSSDMPLGPTDNSNSVMLIEHCAITYSTSFLASQKIPSAIAKIHATAAFSPNAEKRLSLHRSDVGIILLSALEAGRTAAGGSMTATDLASLITAKTPACLADWPLPPQVVPSRQAPSREWLEQPRSTRSADVMIALKGLQHILQEACHKKRSTRLWDSSYVVNGPLTWKDFHKMAWRGSEDACKPQPIPSILVGSDKDWISYSPFVLKYWENLLLRPYGRTHNLAYIVLTPDCGSSSSTSSTGILSSIRTFFRELSTMYETCQLGRHVPLDRCQNLSDGIIQLGRKMTAKLVQQQQAGSEADSQKSGAAAGVGGSNYSWINSLGDDALSKKLKLYAQTFQYILAPLLSQQPLDKSLFETASATKSTQLLVPPAGLGPARPVGSMLAPQPASSTPAQVVAPSSYSLPGQDAHEDRTGDSTFLSGGVNDVLRETEDSGSEDVSWDDIGLTIYIVEDVTFAGYSKLSSLLGSGISKTHWPASAPKPDDEDEDDEERSSSSVGVYGVLRCYHEFLSALPESIRSRVQLQIVPLTMVTHMFGGAGDGICSSNSFGQLSLMKDLCFSVYTQCQHSMSYVPTGRALTSFGPLVSGAAGNTPTTSKIHLAPYILAPQKDVQARLGSNYATDGTCGGGVLLCAYCLSEDQRWLLASVTDDSGELRCTKTINMAITDRSRRKRSLAVHRHGLQKLFEFLLDTIARTCMSWRIVIGRLGRLGHEELKVWATLLNHKCLIRANVRMRGDDCRPCSFLPSATDTPTIVSACVTSLEPHKSFKILTDAVRRPPTHKDKHHTPAVASSMSSAMLAGGSTVAGNASGGALGARLLSTPEDVSCTHILVIPNSTTAGGSHNPPDLPPDLTDDVGIFDFKESDLDMLFGLGGESPGHTSMDSLVGRDSLGETNSGMGGISNSLANGIGLMRGVSTSGGNSGCKTAAASAPGATCANNDSTDEVSPNLLQQPLAMGYYLSTAPAGALPAWFWATCPQEEGACPTSLKFALHFHSFLQQQHQDELVGSTSAASQNRGAPSHPLDSSSTCDVLRFVLETYDKLSWLTVDACTNDRQSCLPVHVSHLVQLSQAIAAIAAAVSSG